MLEMVLVSGRGVHKTKNGFGFSCKKLNRPKI